MICVCTVKDANREFVDRLKDHYVVKRVSGSKLHPDYQSDQIQLITAKLKRVSNSKKNNSPLNTA